MAAPILPEFTCALTARIASAQGVRVRPPLTTLLSPLQPRSERFHDLQQFRAGSQSVLVRPDGRGAHAVARADYPAAQRGKSMDMTARGELRRREAMPIWSRMACPQLLSPAARKRSIERLFR